VFSILAPWWPSQVLRICRVCTNCSKDNENVIEDEIHFLLLCPVYSSIRNKTIDQLCTGINYSNLSPKKKFFYLTTAEDGIVRSVSKFCFEAFDVHSDMLRCSK
jgi:hypothetical protein